MRTRLTILAGAQIVRMNKSTTACQHRTSTSSVVSPGTRVIQCSASGSSVLTRGPGSLRSRLGLFRQRHHYFLVHIAASPVVPARTCRRAHAKALPYCTSRLSLRERQKS